MTARADPTSSDPIEAVARLNAWSRTISRWYYLRFYRKGGENVAHRAQLDGEDALEVFDLVDGKFPDYVGWTEEKLMVHVANVRAIMFAGMTKEQRATWRLDHGHKRVKAGAATRCGCMPETVDRVVAGGACAFSLCPYRAG